jgi:hypothetical protein
MNDRQVSASACGCATVSFVGGSARLAEVTAADHFKPF